MLSKEERKAWKARDRHVQAFRALRARKNKVFDELMRRCGILLRSEKELRERLPRVERTIVQSLRNPEKEVAGKGVSTQEYVKAQLQASKEKLERSFTAVHSMIDFLSFVSANEPLNQAEEGLESAYQALNEADRKFREVEEEYVDEVLAFLDEYYDVFQRFYAQDVRDLKGRSYGTFGQYGKAYLREKLKPEKKTGRVASRFMRVKKYLNMLNQLVYFLRKSPWAPRPAMVAGRGQQRGARKPVPGFGRAEYEEEVGELTPQDVKRLAEFQNDIQAMVARASAPGGPAEFWNDRKKAAEGVSLAQHRVELAEKPLDELQKWSEGGEHPPMYHKYLEWGEHVLDGVENRVAAWEQSLEKMVAIPGVKDLLKDISRMLGRIAKVRAAYEKAKAESQQFIDEYQELYELMKAEVARIKAEEAA